MAERKEKFIQKAIKKPGALHRQLGIPEDEKIPKSKLQAAAKKGNTKLAKRARLALTLEKLPHKGAKKSSAKKSTGEKSTAKKTASGRTTRSKSRAKS
jgi:hypothetical protein